MERVRATQFCPRFQCPTQLTTEIQDVSKPRKLKLSYRQEAWWHAPSESVLVFKTDAHIEEKFPFFRETGFPSRMTIFYYSFAPLQISASLVLFPSCLILNSLPSIFCEDWSDKENVAMGDIIILVCARPNTGKACLWAMLSFLSVFCLSLKIFLRTVLCSVSKCQNEAASDSRRFTFMTSVNSYICNLIPSTWMTEPAQDEGIVAANISPSARNHLLCRQNPSFSSFLQSILICSRILSPELEQKVCNCRLEEQHTLITTHLKKVCFSLLLPLPSPLPPRLSWEHWLINNSVNGWKKEIVPLYL